MTEKIDVVVAETSKKAPIFRAVSKEECVFRADETYRSVLPTMTEDEFASLEATIKRDGCIKDPLVIFHGKLLDGFSRFYIAMKYSLDYSVVELDVETEGEAFIWLVESHCARRHLNRFQIIEMYLNLKSHYADLAKKNLGRKKKGCSENEQHFEPIDTLKKIAEKTTSKKTTVFMVEKIIGSKDFNLIKNCREGSKSISQGYYAITKKDSDDKKKNFANRDFTFTSPQNNFVNKVIQGDVIDVMKKINDELAGKITCILTSPPYNCLEDKYGIDGEGNSINDNKDYYKEYLPWLEECIKEFTKALCDGGRLIINIDAVRHQLKEKGDSYRHTIYPDLINIVKKVAPELRFYHEIIWHKKNPNSHKFSGTRDCQTPQLARNHEYILVWSKSKDSFELPNNDDAPSDIVPAEWPELASSDWFVSSDKTSSEKYPHPAKMSQTIAERLIKLYSYASRSSIILDPFSGSGTTAATAEKMGRSHISIDLNPNYCDLTERRIAEVIAEKNASLKDLGNDPKYSFVA